MQADYKKKEPAQPSVTALPVGAQMLARGFTLEPYYGHNQEGKRIFCCRWVHP